MLRHHRQVKFEMKNRCELNLPVRSSHNLYSGGPVRNGLRGLSRQAHFHCTRNPASV